MKKNLFMVAAVALMALVSCSKENFNDNGVQGEASGIVFSAELEQPAGNPVAEPSEIQSKTSLGTTAVNGKKTVSWIKDDQIKVNGVTFIAASAGPRTDFTTSSSFAASSNYLAVYPASANRSDIVNLQTFPEPDLLYLVPNANWEQANARFAAYFFNSDTDNGWVDINAYNGVYACKKPTAYTTIIFCRMNPAKKENNWDNKWNQTG